MSARVNDRRWLLERKRDDFEDVGADYVEVTYGGALRFSNGALGSHTVYLVAAGEWVSVTREDES